MALYTWRGRNTLGELVQGQLEGVNDAGVADQLMVMGVSPVLITLKTTSEKTHLDPWWAQISHKPVVLEDGLIF